MPVFPHTEDEANHYDLILEWLRIVKRSRNDSLEYHIPTDIDWRKSALFHRMREGKKPLKYPPPRAYSYPWYGIIEDLTPHPIKDDNIFMSSDKEIIICQCPYDIVEKRSNVDFTLKCGNYVFRMWKQFEDNSIWLLQYIRTVE